MTNINVAWELDHGNAQDDLELMLTKVTTWLSEPPPITRLTKVIRGYSDQFSAAFYLAKPEGEAIHLFKINWDEGSCINMTTDDFEKAKWMVASMLMIES